MKCEYLVIVCLIIVASVHSKNSQIQSARDFHFGIVRSTPLTLGLGAKAQKNVKRKKDFLTKHPTKGDRFEEDNKIDCDPKQKCTNAQNNPFRSPDGYCNNLDHAEFGSANIPFRRYLPPVYNDDISAPRMFDSNGDLLPGARKVSRQFHCSVDKEELENSEITHMVMQWGQFLDHDLSITPVQANLSLLDVDKAADDGKGCSHSALPTHDCGDGSTCIRTGDVRAPEQVGLTSMHVLFVREHNRIARTLKTLQNSGWDDERIFQETRKIIGAMMQVITYKEFLPIVLGSTMDKYITEYGDKSNGDPNHIDASIRNVFATAAFRFGHSQIKGRMEAWNKDFASRIEAADLRDLFGQAAKLQSDSCLADEYLRGLAYDRCPKVDRFLSPEVTDRLFEDVDGNKFDLAALNIQRGRDHGLPGYNAWRKFCGLKQFRTFDLMTEHSEEERNILKSLYSSPDEIDLFTAGVSEKHVEGGIVGPTFACIIGQQFQDLKQGDRYWYEATGPIGFTPDQIKELEKTSLSKVMCQCTATTLLQAECMKSSCDCSGENKRASCTELLNTDINLTAWKSVL